MSTYKELYNKAIQSFEDIVEQLELILTENEIKKRKSTMFGSDALSTMKFNFN